MGAASEVQFPKAGALTLDGGLNTKYEKAIIADNESPDCANVVFSNGAVATRGGTAQLNTAAVGSFVCDGLYTRRDDTNAETMIAFFGGTGWALAGTSFSTIPSAQSVFTAGVRVAGCLYRNNLFVGNGNVIPYKYNGTDFTRHGVYPPTNTTSALTNGAGNVPIGTTQYRITYLNSYLVEGDVSSAITLSIAASSVVSLTSLPLAPQSWGVSSRRIYRNDSSSGTTFKLVGTISDNTTTTFTDNTSAGTTNAPTDQGVPPKFDACVYAQNRLFVNDATNRNYVWYSELGEPFTFKATNFIKVGDAASDLVKGFAVYDSAIVIFCENSQWLNVMNSSDPSDWGQLQIRSNFGSKSPFGSWRYDNKIGFPAFQNTKFVGVAAIKGDSVEQSTANLSTAIAGSDLLTDKIEPDMLDVQATYAGNTSAMVYNNKAYISMTKASGNTTNKCVYLFDFSITNLAKSQRFTWVPLTGLDASQFTVYDGKIFYGSSTPTGFVYQAETTSYTDSGSAIDSYFWTKEFSGLPGHENLPKDFRKLKILVDLAGAYSMEIRWRVDSDSGVGQSQNISLDPGSTLWGSFTWGSGTWGGGSNQREFEIPLGQTFGKRIQFKFSNLNTSGQRFKVHRMSFTYNLRGYT